ncbi:hypothetical protein E2C01_071397 [Portunus trituberculatus]|uniref:Uncharacterized protein n=1 Tax=Portunus trituberculatus TaxID=210409 RepID=A0A5B7HWW9_PORTR|nr:hypothetical protein [Portunus trituberculatus]
MVPSRRVTLAAVGAALAMAMLVVTVTGMMIVTREALVLKARYLASNCRGGGGISSCGDGGHGGGGAAVHKAWDPR